MGGEVLRLANGRNVVFRRGGFETRPYEIYADAFRGGHKKGPPLRTSLEFK